MNLKEWPLCSIPPGIKVHLKMPTTHPDWLKKKFSSGYHDLTEKWIQSLQKLDGKIVTTLEGPLMGIEEKEVTLSGQIRKIQFIDIEESNHTVCLDWVNLILCDCALPVLLIQGCRVRNHI